MTISFQKRFSPRGTRRVYGKKLMKIRRYIGGFVLDDVVKNVAGEGE
jgi:hypothetical protein